MPNGRPTAEDWEAALLGGGKRPPSATDGAKELHPRLAVLVIIVIVITALGSIAYWQGLPPFGPSGPETQAAPLPAGTDGQDTETAPPPTATATVTVPTPTLAETPARPPDPTAEPTLTSTTRRAPVWASRPPAPTPTRAHLPTKAPVPAPEQKATPAPAPTPAPTPTATPPSGPEPVTAEITILSFVGTGYTLYLRTGSLPGRRGHEPVTLVIRHADGTVQRKTTYLEQRNDGDYRGTVTVDRERVERADLQWVKQNIEVRVIPEHEAGAAKATPEPTRPKPTSTPRPTPTRRPENTPAPTPTPGPAAQSNLEEKRYMLELINEERRKAGIPELTLGSNRAAQLHAEAALAGCFSSHWGMDGLKPYMRYTLAGGQQSNVENVSGLDYCVRESDGYRQNDTPRNEIGQAMTGLMNSPGHRRNILYPSHRKVNLGLAWDPYNFKTVQHFEGDHIEYSQMPAINNGVLSFAGRLRDGLQFREDRDLGVQVWYDRPPHRLTAGQLSRTYCYDNGRLLASLREPLSGGMYWPTDDFTISITTCPSPYAIPANAPAAKSADEAHTLWLEAYRAPDNSQQQEVKARWITASRWTARGREFAVEANIQGLLQKHRKGIYTIMVWAPSAPGERVLVSQYSIFHRVTPPTTYDPSIWD